MIQIRFPAPAVSIFFLFALLFSQFCFAQPSTTEPKGAAYDEVVQGYLKNDVNLVIKKLPALEKQYPTHLYTIFFKAWVADQSGQDRDGAMRSYSEVIRKDSSFADAYVWRSQLFWNKGLDERAISDISIAIKIQGTGAPAYYFSMRGDYYYSAKNYTAAMADFRQAIKQAPAHPANYIGFMNVAFNAGNQTETERILKQAVEGAQKENADLYFVYADFLLRSNRFNESDALFTKAFSMQGNQPSPVDYNTAAIAAYKLKNYNKAVLLSEKAIFMSPRNVSFLTNRANIAIDQQRWEDVYQWAQKALAVDANDPFANMLMAVGIKRTGRGEALSAEYEAKAKKLAAGN